MSPPPRVVLDTNVVLSALLWKGKPGRLIAMAGDGLIELFTSPTLFTELGSVLETRKLARKLALTDRSPDDVLLSYRSISTLVVPSTPLQRYSRDPDDDHVIACAVAARADILITGDDDLLVLGEVDGIRIRTVIDALEELA